LRTRKPQNTLTLSEYVRRRNGVALGAPSSLKNMMARSLGARSFAVFWQYWNPIWGYYLAKKVYSPLSQFLSSAQALIATFLVSGLIHDLAVTLILGTPVFICTPWFFFLGLGVMVGKIMGMNLSHYSWVARATVNTLYLAACLGLALGVRFLWSASA
jgi:hypothetical protein